MSLFSKPRVKRFRRTNLRKGSLFGVKLAGSFGEPANVNRSRVGSVSEYDMPSRRDSMDMRDSDIVVRGVSNKPAGFMDDPGSTQYSRVERNYLRGSGYPSVGSPVVSSGWHGPKAVKREPVKLEKVERDSGYVPRNAYDVPTRSDRDYVSRAGMHTGDPRLRGTYSTAQHPIETRKRRGDELEEQPVQKRGRTWTEFGVDQLRSGLHNVAVPVATAFNTRLGLGLAAVDQGLDYLRGDADVAGNLFNVASSYGGGKLLGYTRGLHHMSRYALPAVAVADSVVPIERWGGPVVAGAAGAAPYLTKALHRGVKKLMKM